MAFSISPTRSEEASKAQQPLNMKKAKKHLHNEEVKKHFEIVMNEKDSSKAKPASKMNNLMDTTVEEQLDFGMQIFLASLKNQIPGNETNTDEMVRTLMQMTATIQQARSNKLLEDGNKVQEAIYATNLTKFEGDMVEHPGDTFTFDGRSQEIFYSFGENAEEVTLNIFNFDTKELVRTERLDPRQLKGSFVWDGKDNAKSNSPKGQYRIFLTALDKKQKAIKTELSLNSRVTSTHFDKDNSPALMSGRTKITEISGHKRDRHLHKAIPTMVDLTT